MTPPEELFAESEAYERFMGRWSRRVAPLLVELASVGPGDAVLDVGCGTGALALAVVRACPSAAVTGVDPSSAYVRAAQANAPAGRARFLVGDAQALRLPDASFDRALSLLALNFVPDPAKALREMIRVTRPGGIVAGAVWDYGEGMELLRAFWDAAAGLHPAAAARDERHMPLCRRGELAAAWRAGGLRDVEERPLAAELTFDAFDDCWSPFLGGQGPAGAFVAALPPAARPALAAALRGRLLGGREDGPFTLGARAWAARGVVPAR
jgi:SAM-dependent methyltransferase